MEFILPELTSNGFGLSMEKAKKTVKNKEEKKVQSAGNKKEKAVVKQAVKDTQKVTGKEQAKTAKKTEGAAKTAKKEKIKYTPTKEQKKQRKKQKKVLSKKRPKFSGRFGKSGIRRKKVKKWAKWRKPRGIDIKRNKFYGRTPNSGYGTNKEIRGLHPSGLKEVLIANIAELEKIEKNAAIRFKAGIGKKKRKLLIQEAKKKELRMLN